MKSDHHSRLERASASLTGLSVGDALGDQFFVSDQIIELRLQHRSPPPPVWFVTDDTIMAQSVVEVLSSSGIIDQDHLAQAFANRYTRDTARGYGGTAHRILRAIASGAPWQVAASEAFDGMGSMGNGGAMRAGPLGAWFACDPVEVILEQAQRSAEVTHSHPEGQAGAMAVALAAAYAVNHPGSESCPEVLAHIHSHLPDGETRSIIRRAMGIPFSRPPGVIAAMLGSGERVLAQDTVPFALWCAARHWNSYPAAIWSTVSGLGDRDTTCAIVGSIVSLSAGVQSIPQEWIESREPLPP